MVNTVYVGNLTREDLGTHLTVKERDVSPNRWKELSEYASTNDYEKSIAVKLDEFSHGGKILAKVVLNQSSRYPEMEFVAEVSKTNRDPLGFIEVQPLDKSIIDFLSGPPTKDFEGHSGKMYVNPEHSQITPIISLDESYEHFSLLPYPKFKEISDIIKELMHEELSSIDLVRRNENTVYNLTLRSGRKFIMKDFADEKSFKLESLLLQELSGLNLSPPVLAVPKRLKIFSDYLGNKSLLQSSENELADYFDQAIEIISAIERIGKQKKDLISKLNVPVLTEKYFKRKYNRALSVKTESVSLISPTLYCGHFIIDEKDKRLKRIDLEDVYFGPVEVSLVNLFLAFGSNFSMEFIRKRLDHYASLKKGEFNEEKFYKSFYNYLDILGRNGERTAQRARDKNL